MEKFVLLMWRIKKWLLSKGIIMTRLRYFIVTLVTLEPGVIGGMSSKTQYLGLSLDRFINPADINKLIETNRGKSVLSMAPVGTSFMEVTATDFEAFFKEEKKEAEA